MTNKLNQTPIAATIADGQNTLPLSEPIKYIAEPVREPREGSTLHYATLRMDPAARQRLLCVFELTHAIAKTLVGVQEPAVAQTKLQWWTEEIERLANKAPRHPTTQRCVDWMGDNESAHACLTAILDSATAARFDAPANDEDWTSVVERDYAARLQLMHDSVKPNSTTPLATDLTELAIAAAWVDILRSLPQRIHHDQIALPPSLYEQFELSQALVQKHIRVAGRSETELNNVPPEPIQLWLQAGVEQALTAINTATKSNTHQALRLDVNTRAMSAWLHLRQAQLQLWRKQQPNLLTGSVTLTPIRKWYIAFKHR